MDNPIEKFNIQIHGTEDQPLLLINGFGCTQKIWDALTVDFSVDHQIIQFDHVGTFGASKSEFSAEKYSNLTAYANDIIEICEFLEISEVIAVGHSIGCMMGVLAAIKRPELFKALVLITPSPRHLPDENYSGGFSKASLNDLLRKLDKDSSDWVDYMAPIILGNEEGDNKLANELIEMFCSLPNDVVKTMAKTHFMNDSRLYLKQLSQKTLVIQTEKDLLVPSEVTQFLLDEIPNAEVAYLAVEGHCPHFSHPELVVEVMQSFIKQFS